MSAYHEQAIDISSLPTRSATFYTSSAAVVRDVPVVVKPGRNVYTITGISPHLDVSSFRVAGHGTDALISDTNLQLVPQNVPDDSAVEPEDESNVEDTVKLEKLEGQLADLKIEQESAEIDRATVTNRLDLMDHFGNSIIAAASKGEDLVQAVNVMQTFSQVYADTRSELAQKRITVECRARELAQQHAELSKEHNKQLRQVEKARQKRLKDKKTGQNQVAQNDIPKPLNVYSARITIEQESLPPKTTSVVATVRTGKPKAEDDDAPPVDSDGPSLRISYVVNAARWWPKYELRLDTIEQTALLTYRAEAVSTCGEIWTDATVTLSTAQNRFSGLGEHIPVLQAWEIGLGGKEDAQGSKAALYSRQEIQRHSPFFDPLVTSRAMAGATGAIGSLGSDKAPTNLFGNKVPDPPSQRTGLFGKPYETNTPFGSGVFGANSNNPPQTGSLFGNSGGFGNAAPRLSQAGGLFGNAAPPALASSQAGGLFGSAAPPAPAQSQAGSLFGNSGGFGNAAPRLPQAGGLFGNAAPTTPALLQTGGLFGNAAPPAPASFQAGGLFGNATPPAPALSQAGGLFGNAAPPAPASLQAGGLFGSAAPPAPTSRQFSLVSPQYSPNSAASDSNSTASRRATPIEFDPQKHMGLATADTSSYGITTTSTLPGRRSIVPSYTPKAWVLSETALENTSFLYNSVPKLHPTVYLALAFTLPAGAMPLLKDVDIGITLDGSFLGKLRTKSNRSPGDCELLDLGVEERLSITCTPPTSKVRIDGVIRREAVTTVKRGWVLKSAMPKNVHVHVTDQVPTTSDEGVSIQVIEMDGGEENDTKDGKITWMVMINPNETVKRKLEYTVKTKEGEILKSCVY